MSDIENKLLSARTRLILDKPFLGALVLRLPMQQADPSWCSSTFSDGKTFYYNSDYIDELDIEQTQFALSHEALHCALSHFYRRGHRTKTRWDIACDYAVNPLLINDGLKPTPEARYQEEYEGMTAEEIYPCLDDEEPDDEPQDEDDADNQEDNDNKDDDRDADPEENDSDNDSDSDGEGNQDKDQGQDSDGNSDSRSNGGSTGAPKPGGMSTREMEELNTQWQQRTAAAAQSAHQRGSLTGDMARMVDFLLQAQLPWRMLLARYMAMTARDDYSYSRPSSRRGDPAVYPSMRSSETNIVVVIDTSGSIDKEEMREFISEIDAIKSYVRARITLLACDSELDEGCPWCFEPWDEFNRDVAIGGGGGTNFRPPFEWQAGQDRDPDLLIYFTDAIGLFPSIEPMYPVLWLIKGHAKVPFGDRIQLN